ncbi:hypothetical protein NQ315_010690 [Exocentrus adspersus]|uniref:Cytoplasmic tRNA 2-thiolation protein 1 n=1 Tax=Exocentrus adspersus TaxID=1586481 RepID=A0AAV8VU99_9CUCU|nr:hypothetical protein NQ315_010690 [Exocentrus adspersus]
MDAIDLLEKRIEALELQVLSKDTSASQTQAITDLLMQTHTMITSALSCREAITSILQHMTTINEYLDPSYGENVLEVEAKRHYLLELYPELKDTVKLIGTFENLIPYADSANIVKVTELSEKLDRLAVNNLSIYEESVEVTQNVLASLQKYNDITGSIKVLFAQLDRARPKTGDTLCKECFFEAFENEIHFTITKANLFKRDATVAIAASGGKDSTVLAYIMKLLNEKYNYGLKLVLLSIDEGITGYRDDSLDTVKQNRDDYGIPLKILSYKDLYGWTMDEIIGRKNNCTFCGVFRRQALDRGANLLKVDYLATGHNADDIAETVLMNILRGDLARLSRCTSIITDSGDGIPRVKPLKYTYEKEIVMYAYFRKLVYFSTECIFAPNAYRGHARVLLKDLEKIDPSIIMNIIESGESIKVNETTVMPSLTNCTRCGYVSSQQICKACVLLEGLNKGLPRLGIGKSSKVKRILQENEKKQQCCSSSTEKCSKATSIKNDVEDMGKDSLCNGVKASDISKLSIDQLTI